MASTDTEVTEITSGGAPVEIDLSDTRRTRPAMEEGEKGFEGGAVAFGSHFDGTIGLIAYPSAEAEFSGAALSRIAEADALHPPMHYGVKLFCFGFAHDICFS